MIKSGIGTQGEVSRLQKCFIPSVIYSTDRSKAVVPVLVLLYVALCFFLRGDFLIIALYYFVLVFFSLFSIAITSLGEEIANLSAFRTLDLRLFGFVSFLLTLVSGKSCGVIVALPVLFSYFSF